MKTKQHDNDPNNRLRLRLEYPTERNIEWMLRLLNRIPRQIGRKIELIALIQSEFYFEWREVATQCERSIVENRIADCLQEALPDGYETRLVNKQNTLADPPSGADGTFWIDHLRTTKPQ